MKIKTYIVYRDRVDSIGKIERSTQFDDALYFCSHIYISYNQKFLMHRKFFKLKYYK